MESDSRATRLGVRASLPNRLADDMRARLAAQEWQPGERLPTEAEMVDSYGTSRTTVRQALKLLESRGLIVTRQGRGSFVAEESMIRAGMQEMKSITATIAEMGHKPSMHYHHRILRPATRAELEKFDIPDGSEVLDIQRRILADGITVAYSFDALPRWVFPDDFSPSDLTGSVFGFLESHHGPVPMRANAWVHAVHDPSIAWDGELGADELFVLLDQLHYDKNNRPFMYTQSYFIEGRFNFMVLRTAP